MAKQYQFRTYTDYQSDTPLSYGVSPNDTSWHTTDNLTGSRTADYYYRDANSPIGVPISDANSIGVIVSVTDNWSVSFDSNNNMTVTLSTMVNSISRADLSGTVYATPGRNIILRRSIGSPDLWSYNDMNVNVVRTIATGLNLGSETFTLAPGQDATRSSIFLHNQVIGEASFDNIFIGTQFRNILPADYRPGMIWDGNTWQSHNRDNGYAGIWDGNTYREMRTVDGGTGTGNPPSIRHDNDWRNMRKLGANG